MKDPACTLKQDAPMPGGAKTTRSACHEEVLEERGLGADARGVGNSRGQPAASYKQPRHDAGNGSGNEFHD